MNQTSHNSTPHLLLFLFLFLILLVSSSSSKSSAATFLVTKHEEIQEEQTFKEMTITKGESVDDLMGLEDCGKEEDEECLKRRIIAEAHLDYIYTQHHKP